MILDIALITSIGILMLTVFIGAGALSRLTQLVQSIHDHYLPTDLTKKAVGRLIADLENGGTLDKYTLDEAITTLTNNLTDLLLGNGYDLSRWNPQLLLLAVLGSTPLLQQLTTALTRAAARKSNQHHDAL